MTHIAGQRTQNNEADARKRKTAGAAEATTLSAHFSHALGNKISRQVAKSGQCKSSECKRNGKTRKFFRRWCCELRVRELHGCLRNDRRGFEGCGSKWKTKRDNFPKIEKKFNDSRVLTDLTGPNSIIMSFRSTRNFPRLLRGEVCLGRRDHQHRQAEWFRWMAKEDEKRLHEPDADTARNIFRSSSPPNSMNFRRKRGDKKFVVKHSFCECVWGASDEKHWPPKNTRCSRRVDYANRAIIKFLRRSDLRCAKQVQATLFTLGLCVNGWSAWALYCWPLLHSK